MSASFECMSPTVNVVLLCGPRRPHCKLHFVRPSVLSRCITQELYIGLCNSQYHFKVISLSSQVKVVRPGNASG